MRITFFSKYFGQRPLSHTIGLVLADALLLSLALLAAYFFRFFDPENTSARSSIWLDRFYMTVIWLVPIQVICLLISKHYNSVLRYFRLPEVEHILVSLFTAFIFEIFLSIVTRGATRFYLPYTVIGTDFFFALNAICGSRILIRMFYDYASDWDSPAGEEQDAPKCKRVGILGAGDTGAALVASWLAKPGMHYKPVAFFDDDDSKQGLRIHTIPIVDKIDALGKYFQHLALDEIVIAVGNAPQPRIRSILKMTRHLGLQTEIVSSITEMASGRVKLSRSRPVQIQDLLGREPVKLNEDNIHMLFSGRTVLVTGAGGSIGSELCRQIATHMPAHLLVVERCETQLFQVEQALIELGHGAIIQPIVADVTNEAQMRHILKYHKPDVIFHAAAHKHVPMMEHQPREAIRNNTFGTRLLIDLAIELGVTHFVLISTDKAINPTSVMGATKRMAEIYLQSRQEALENEASQAPQPFPVKTRLMAVRFGNVLDSSGSVVPMFKKQIAEGGPIKVTHPEVVRYFMTIPEAAGLVLQCATLGKGGEIFVLNMGSPIKIVDLAHLMIELSGYRPNLDIQIEFTGLRPGEKLFEELQHVNEHHKTTEHPKIMRFVNNARPIEQVTKAFAQLDSYIHALGTNEIKRKINEIVPEYKPYLKD
ncbi:MAG: polysaccharide biosynthesis protein [Puniceicoccales bacterium]|jgi:FlaA1/EpsC-like NDP-sugar epimerase|nr:polysaccharide biosynthesis protein [Puniceicoccales bacterium]